jgi:dienelactone hydrolase
MQLQSLVWSFALGHLARLGCAEPIPKPSGEFNVGMRRFVVDFTNADDPTSPNNVSTGYLATIYYPTEDDPAPPAPYVEPELAQMYADAWEFNISHLTTTMRWNASFLPSKHNAGPTLVFGPGGWGPTTDGSRILLQDLASHGYTVAAIDHPYEQPFLRFPNGTGVVGLPVNLSSTIEFINAYHPVRIREMLHFVDYWPKLVKKLCAPFQKDNLGAFGISFGGSVALNVAIESDKIAAANNIDGSIFGPASANLSSSDAEMPVLLLGFDGHVAREDQSWNNFTTRQSGWWRGIYVEGTVHQDWSDMGFWKIWGTTRELGPIDGRRMVDVRSAYVRAFFDEHLRGEESLLMDGPVEEWPEVVVDDGSDGDN